MGGWGSGPRHRRGKKRPVEDCHVLDVSALRRAGLLAAGERAGSLALGGSEPRGVVDYAATVGEDEGAIRLVYRFPKTGERFEYPVRLETTPCRFGGQRWWLVCPLSVDDVVCGRRVQKLYLATRYFGCRACLNLTYASAQESDRRVYAAVRRGQHLGGCSGREVRRMSVADLAFALKVVRFRRRQLDKIRDRVGG